MQHEGAHVRDGRTRRENGRRAAAVAAPTLLTRTIAPRGAYDCIGAAPTGRGGSPAAAGAAARAAAAAGCAPGAEGGGAKAEKASAKD